MIHCLKFNPNFQDKLDAFFKKVFRSNGFIYDPDRKHNDLRNINTVFVDSGGGFWFLIKDNEIIGTAGLKITDNIKKIGELKCMYILPDFQGQGFGQLLIEKILTESKQIKLKYIRLDVKINADKAIRLYRKNGFYDIQRYNDNKNDVIFMEKDLKNYGIQHRI